MEPEAGAVEQVGAGYDAIYDGYRRSPTLRAIWRDGRREPPGVENLDQLGFVTIAELRRISEALALTRDAMLLDLGCGSGGPGQWIAAHTGARVIGIDVSREGIARAVERAETSGLVEQTSYRVADLERTGLEPATADAAVSIDALQYVADKRPTLREVARVLRPGARLALTAFEIDPDRASPLPIYGNDPTADFRPALEDAGFTIETYEETAGWHDRVMGTFRAVLEHYPQLEAELGKQAASLLAAEARVALETGIYRRRVLACVRK